MKTNSRRMKLTFLSFAIAPLSQGGDVARLEQAVQSIGTPDS